jgi:hypothetical protein
VEVSEIAQGLSKLIMIGKGKREAEEISTFWLGKV